ncbi:MAG: GGDEF domain-containing protein [Pseudomonadota bacterium]
MGSQDTGEHDYRGVRGTRRLATSDNIWGGDEEVDPRLVVLTGSRMGEPFLIVDGAELVIGRDIQTDLVLESRSVSRRHARISRLADQVYIEDLGSANGSDVAGERIKGRVALRNGDLLRLGTATLKYFASASLESEYHRKIFDMATRDGLTGLRNRSYFMDALKRMLPQHTQREVPLSLAIVDLDYFKVINDEYGHDVGDQALRDTARTLERGIGELDIVARIGGEEFALILDAADAEQAVKTLVQLQVDLADVTRSPDRPMLSFSAGVVTVPADVEEDDVSKLLKSADLALYKAKQNGRDRVEVAD